MEILGYEVSEAQKRLDLERLETLKELLPSRKIKAKQ